MFEVFLNGVIVAAGLLFLTHLAVIITRARLEYVAGRRREVEAAKASGPSVVQPFIPRPMSDEEIYANLRGIQVQRAGGWDLSFDPEGRGYHGPYRGVEYMKHKLEAERLMLSMKFDDPVPQADVTKPA